MKDYYKELDFIKGIYIILMVLFHLIPFVMKYQELTSWVYCFHMSGFLIISGYLQNSTSKTKLLKSIRKILIPYIIFEVLYLVGLGYLQDIVGSSNRVELSVTNFIYYILLKPSGTYWYLHTLFICIVVSYFIEKTNLTIYNKLIITTSILFILSTQIVGLNFENVIYFIIGKTIQKSGYNIVSLIKPTIFAIIPIILISINVEDYSRGSLHGIILTLTITSFLFYVYKYMNDRINKFIEYIGKNSLSIVLFSPIFTVMTKLYLNIFKFDNTLLLWAFVSLSLIITMCLFSAWILDRIHITKYIFKGNLYYSYNY